MSDLVSKKIDKSAHKKDCAHDVANIFSVLNKNFPNLYVVLSTMYSTDTPGFIHIKWNDDLRSIVNFLKENVHFAADKIANVPLS